MSGHIMLEANRVTRKRFKLPAGNEIHKTEAYRLAEIINGSGKGVAEIVDNNKMVVRSL